jgi:3,4-dihydroxy 2-butanone 4-phosphate synthase/GTP cyclohydrolase II
MVEEAGNGVILYMREENRGVGGLSRNKEHALIDQECCSVEANLGLGLKPDLRDYGIGAQILADLGVSKMRLMTNNPTRIVGLEGYNLEIVAQVPLAVDPHCTDLVI